MSSDKPPNKKRPEVIWSFIGALGGTRTPNLLIRSQMLYPLSYKREVGLDECLHSVSIDERFAEPVRRGQTQRLAKGLVGTSVAESEGFEPSREI